MKLKHYLYKRFVALVKKVYRVSRYHYLALDNMMLAKLFELPINERSYQPTSKELKIYDQKWRKFGIDINHIYVKNAAAILGYFDVNIIPSDIYFSVIEPALNNRKFSLQYEDKSSIDWINWPEHVPTIFVRNINGVYYNSDRSVIDKSEIDLVSLLKGVKGIVAKKSIEMHGGKGIEMFDNNGGDNLLNKEGEKLTLNYLEEKYECDFIIQEQVEQHPFYKALNPSSLNTFRVFTYRSVVDNTIHVLYSFLRIGAPNSRIDNISTGGIFLCVKPDKHFFEYGLKKGGKKVYQLGDNPPFKEFGKPPFIDEVYDLAKRLAMNYHYSRLIGFDLAIDGNGKIIHIETNTSDIGMEGLQYIIGPMFNLFTDEVLDYCRAKLQNTSKYHLYDS